MKRITVTLLVLSALGSAVLYADGVPSLEAISDASAALQTFSATIMMTKYTGDKGSTIEFRFTFVPPAKMRIEYTGPATLVGQLLILNGDRFYTYMPALHRSVYKTVNEGEGAQGEEMGFLYYFVSQKVDEFLLSHSPSSVNGPEEYTFEYGDDLIRYTVYMITLTGDDEKQAVWLDAKTLVPVAVEIYEGDRLAIEVRVIDYQYNKDIPEDAFTIPDRG